MLDHAKKYIFKGEVDLCHLCYWSPSSETDGELSISFPFVCQPGCLSTYWSRLNVNLLLEIVIFPNKCGQNQRLMFIFATSIVILSVKRKLHMTFDVCRVYWSK